MNIPALYPDKDIDPTSYCILLKIRELDVAWKRKIHRELNAWRDKDMCPINKTETVSLQTVCRRIDFLEQKGMLEGTPRYSEKASQYITDFTLTTEGTDALEAITEQMIQNIIVMEVRRRVRGDDIQYDEGVFEKLSANPFTSDDITPTTLTENATTYLKKTSC